MLEGFLTKVAAIRDVLLCPEMAIRISKATNTSAESWMNMQQKLSLWIAQQHEPSNVIPFSQNVVDEG